jgi:hypothetical protein
MRTGSVIVDLAGEAGGNCELTVPGETVVREGVTIIAPLNMPSLMPVHGSQMYARVVQNFLGLLIQDGQVHLNLDDAIIKGMCITREGQIIQEQTRQVMNLGPLDVPAAEPEPELEPVVVDDPETLDVIPLPGVGEGDGGAAIKNEQVNEPAVDDEEAQGPRS